MVAGYTRIWWWHRHYAKFVATVDRARSDAVHVSTNAPPAAWRSQRPLLDGQNTSGGRTPLSQVVVSTDHEYWPAQRHACCEDAFLEEYWLTTTVAVTSQTKMGAATSND